MIKPYSEIAIAIDLVAEVYKTFNPIIIAEKCKEDLDISLTIYQVIDYYELHYNYTFEEPIKEYY